jgi:hypothetical protein
MILTEIDHVAIAVHDLEAAIDYYKRAFGAEVHHREVVESDGVEEALIKVADSYIQPALTQRWQKHLRSAARVFITLVIASITVLMRLPRWSQLAQQRLIKNHALVRVAQQLHLFIPRDLLER